MAFGIPWGLSVVAMIVGSCMPYKGGGADVWIRTFYNDGLILLVSNL